MCRQVTVTREVEERTDAGSKALRPARVANACCLPDGAATTILAPVSSTPARATHGAGARALPMPEPHMDPQATAIVGFARAHTFHDPEADDSPRMLSFQLKPDGAARILRRAILNRREEK